MTYTDARPVRWTLHEVTDTSLAWPGAGALPAMNQGVVSAGVRGAPARDPRVAEALTMLDRLGRLPPGWDGDVARPVATGVLEAVDRFIRSGALDQANAAALQLVPTAQGGLQLEWHTEDLDLVLECEPSGAVSYYVSDVLSGEEAEGSVDGTGDRLLARAFLRLASVG